MAISPEATSHRPGGQSRNRTRQLQVAGRSALYCASLLPLALGAVVVAAAGRARATNYWWRWLRTRVLGQPPAQATRVPGYPGLVGHALLSLLLGAAACVPLAIEAVFVARGVFYGLADPGPYTDSWGGPTRAGAWLAHFLAGAPFAIAGLFALIGIAAAHQRLTLVLDGGRRAPWLVPVTLLIALAGTVFLVAWLRQLPS